jgi:hypothetical protein
VGDATLDGPAPEDGGPGVTGDATSVEAGGSTDAGASGFTCAAQDASVALFCADFDHVATVGAGWSATLAVSGGTNAFDTTSFRSAPNGYVATVPVLTATAGFAALEESSLSSTASLQVQFAMLMHTIDGTTPGASATMATLRLGSLDPHSLTISFVLTGHELSLQQSTPAPDGGTITQSNDCGGIGTTAWTPVQITIDRSVTPWAIALSRDGVVKANTTSIATPADPSVALSVGVVFVSPPSTGYSATFDNVLIRTL